jgi:hypothetical protein
MRNIAIIDENFDSNATSDYHLSVQYGDRFCSFAILDTVSMKYLAFKNFWFTNPVEPGNQAEHIRTLLHSESFLTRLYKSAYFLYLVPRSVLVPAKLFNDRNPEVFMNLSLEILPEEKVMYRKIQSIDSYVVFTVPEEFISQVESILHDVRFFHQSCPQIEAALAESNGESGAQKVYASIQHGFTDLMIVRSGKLLFYNSFKISNSEDLAYFILNLYEQFGMSQDESPVIISGFPELYPGILPLLHQYLKNVSLCRFPARYTYSNTFSVLAQHNFAQLIQLAGCE